MVSSWMPKLNGYRVLGTSVFCLPFFVQPKRLPRSGPRPRHRPDAAARCPTCPCTVLCLRRGAHAMSCFAHQAVHRHAAPTARPAVCSIAAPSGLPAPPCLPSTSKKGSKPAGTIYFYRRFRLSTDCVISSGGSLRKPPVEIHDL
jgi:hypothetical protein